MAHLLCSRCMIRTWIGCCVFSFVCCINANAQQAKIDSLLIVLERSKEDTNKVTTLVALCYEYRLSQSSDAFSCAQQAVTLARKLSSERLLARALVAFGLVQLDKGILKEAETSFETGLSLSEKHNEGATIASALRGLGGVKDKQGKSDQARLLFEKALDVSKSAGDKRGIAFYYYAMGSFSMDDRKLDQAMKYYQRCLKIREELRDTMGIAYVHFRIARIHENLHEDDAAMRCYQRSLNLSRQLRFPYGVANTLHNMGMLRSNQGQYDQALQYHLQSLAIREGLGRTSDIASSLHSIGFNFQQQGRNDQALVYYQRCLDLFGTVKDRHLMAKILNNMGNIFSAQGKFKLALKHLHQSLELKETLKDRDGMAASLNNIGNIQFNTGKLDQALDSYTRGLQISEEAGNTRWQISALMGLSHVHTHLYHFDLAASYADRCLKLMEKLGDNAAAANILIGLGDDYDLSGNLDKAIDCYQRGSRIAEQHGLNATAAAAQGNIAQVYRQQGKYDLAMENHLKSLDYFQKAGKRWDEEIELVNIALVHTERGDFDRSQECLLRSLKIGEEIGEAAELEIARACRGLAVIYKHLGLLDRSVDYARRSLALCERKHDRIGTVESLDLLGTLYDLQQRPQEALDHLFRAIDIRRTLHRTTDTELQIIADIYGRQGNNDESFSLHMESFRIRRVRNERRGMSQSLQRIAEMYMAQKLYDSAISAATQSYTIAKEIGFVGTAADAARTLATANEHVGEIAKAVKYMKEYVILRDSLFNESKFKSINETAAKYEMEKKEQAIAMLEVNMALQAQELRRRHTELELQRLEGDRTHQHALLLERDKEVQALELRQKKDEYTRTKNERDALQKQQKADQIVRNAIILCLGMFFVIGFLGVKRIQHKKQAATLRAEAAEYQAQAAEYQARATETEMLRMQAEAERQSREAQQEYSLRLIESQERERARVAAELHDGLGQELLVISSQADMGLLGDEACARESLHRITDLAKAAVGDVRRISRNLRPIHLERVGITNTLIDTMEVVSLSSGIGIESDIDRIDDALSPDGAINLYRIVQEGINNILRHAHARRADLRITRERDTIHVRIADDGEGFDPALLGRPGGAIPGLGLHGMRERVHLLGGTMNIQSAQGTGTTIEIVIPLPEVINLASVEQERAS